MLFKLAPYETKQLFVSVANWFLDGHVNRDDVKDIVKRGSDGSGNWGLSGEEELNLSLTAKFSQNMPILTFKSVFRLPRY